MTDGDAPRLDNGSSWPGKGGRGCGFFSIFLFFLFSFFFIFQRRNHKIRGVICLWSFDSVLVRWEWVLFSSVDFVDTVSLSIIDFFCHSVWFCFCCYFAFLYCHTISFQGGNTAWMMCLQVLLVSIVSVQINHLLYLLCCPFPYHSYSRVISFWHLLKRHPCYGHCTRSHRRHSPSRRQTLLSRASAVARREARHVRPAVEERHASSRVRRETTARLAAEAAADARRRGHAQGCRSRAATATCQRRRSRHDNGHSASNVAALQIRRALCKCAAALAQHGITGVHVGEGSRSHNVGRQ